MQEEEEDLCTRIIDASGVTCGHDVEDHNDIWKRNTKCHKCSCEEWEARKPIV